MPLEDLWQIEAVQKVGAVCFSLQTVCEIILRKQFRQIRSVSGAMEENVAWKWPGVMKAAWQEGCGFDGKKVAL